MTSDGDFEDYVDIYDGTQGWLSVRSFAAADVMIAQSEVGANGMAPRTRNKIKEMARWHLEAYHRAPDSAYRLRLALGASYVLLRLEHGDLVQDDD